MLVMKCDRCGKIYEAEMYETTKLNSIVFANHSFDGIKRIKDDDGCMIIKDFCNDCVADFEAFLNNVSRDSEPDENQINMEIIPTDVPIIDTPIDYDIFGKFANAVKRMLFFYKYEQFEHNKDEHENEDGEYVFDAKPIYTYGDLITVPKERIEKTRGIGVRAMQVILHEIHKLGLKFDWEEN